MSEPEIRIKDYTYELPENRIATYPLARRDSSKLLIYNNGNISDSLFSTLPERLPGDAMMVFNDTKVVPARLLFRKDTGAFIEIFCLEPYSPNEYNLAFAATGKCVWKAIIGNLKRWKSGIIHLFVPEDHDSSVSKINLCAQLLKKEDNSFIVEFTWDGDIPFSQVLDSCGKIPIPPYLNRETETIDLERYQTLYARYRGSVAAPTAGLHFTEEVLDNIHKKGIECHEVCLHVGAGTFLPVKSELIHDHIMHSEPFSVTATFLSALYNKPDNKPLIAVGTTSTRTLESLYFFGVQCIKATPEKWHPITVSQWEPYQEEYDYTLKESIGALLEYLKINKLDIFSARTQIIIVPTYKYRVVDILITNFHQPQSTLLLLIAAFIGEDWKKVYEYALGNGFRFLSYGDSSLLFKNRKAFSD